jgi:hypothetical protein
VKRGGPINPQSPKRRSQQATRDAVIEAVLDRDRGCRGVGLIPNHVCGFIPGRKALEVHEVIPRSAWAEGYLVESNCVALCAVAHNWVDANPSAAHEVGLHKFSWERE